MAQRVKEPKLYTLIVPVKTSYRRADALEVTSETITTVKVRPPTVGDMRAFEAYSGGDIAKGISMVARLIDLPEEVVDLLDMEDFVKITEIMDGFLPDGLKTGDKPGPK